MRKIVVQQFVTLDGFAAGPNGELDFVTETGAAADPSSGPFVEDQLAFIESLDTIVGWVDLNQWASTRGRQG